MATLTINNSLCGSLITTTTTIGVYSLNYGLLYNQTSILGSGGGSIANDGWHVPSMAELATLFDNLASTVVTADAYGAGIPSVSNSISSEISTVRHDSIGWSSLGTNTTGLGLRGGGRRDYDGPFVGLDSTGTFWSSDVDGSVFWGLFVSVSASNIITSSERESQGHSVILIKDSTLLSNGESGFYEGNDGKYYVTICYGGVEYVVNIAETQFRDNSPIPYVSGDADWQNAGQENDGTPARCAYDNNLSYI